MPEVLIPEPGSGENANAHASSGAQAAASSEHRSTNTSAMHTGFTLGKADEVVFSPDEGLRATGVENLAHHVSSNRQQGTEGTKRWAVSAWLLLSLGIAVSGALLVFFVQKSCERSSSLGDADGPHSMTRIPDPKSDKKAGSELELGGDLTKATKADPVTKSDRPPGRDDLDRADTERWIAAMLAEQSAPLFIADQFSDFYANVVSHDLTDLKRRMYLDQRNGKSALWTGVVREVRTIAAPGGSAYELLLGIDSHSGVLDAGFSVEFSADAKKVLLALQPGDTVMVAGALQARIDSSMDFPRPSILLIGGKVFSVRKKSAGENERTFLTTDLGSIVSSVREMTTLETDGFVERVYRDKWFRWVGFLDDVYKDREGRLHVKLRSLTRSGGVLMKTVEADFEKPENQGPIATARKGEIVGLRGRLVDVGIWGIRLKECEYVPGEK